MSEQVTRGRLPHWYMPGAAHFVTYRVANSIPISLLRAWRDERENLMRPRLGVHLSYEERMNLHKKFFARYDRYLDLNHACDWLARPEIASIVKENLYHHHGKRYELLAYSVMPNHVHVLLQPLEKRVERSPNAGSEAGSFDYGDIAIVSDEISDSRSPLSAIMHSLKSYTANQANIRLGRQGQFWQHESYDHWVRDVDELQRIVDYICLNPVRAGLCNNPVQWPFGSAIDRFERDGDRCGIVGSLRDDWH